MRLGDDALLRLTTALDEPDLSGTRYRLIGPLGQGGMGNVYVAEDTVLLRNVALKVLRVQDSTGELAARLESEARVAAALEHPGIIPIHDLGILPDGRVFYVSKLVQGIRLDEYAARTESLADKLRVFIKICEAVAYAHSRKVLHRDLKPANIMVGEFGEVLILDWGTAREQQADASHTAGHGTHGYMPPEQERGEALDARADIFALGATLREFVTLRSMPKPLASIITKAMHHDKSGRYDSALALSDDVARFIDGEPVAAHRETPLEMLVRQVNKHRFILIILLTYMLIRLIFFLALKR